MSDLLIGNVATVGRSRLDRPGCDGAPSRKHIRPIQTHASDRSYENEQRIRQNHGMTGSALAHYKGIKAFSETDQTDDLKAIKVPTLVMQGDDDQVVPYKNAVELQAALLPNATKKVYKGYSHGMLTVNADVLNADLLAFVRS